MKVASRFLLPVEMLLGLYTLLWGLSGLGVFGACTLYYSLLALDHNLEWGLALGFFGLAMMLVAAVEWFFGRMPTRPMLFGPLWLLALMVELRHWLSDPRTVYLFVSARATIAFFMCGVWIAAAAIVFTSPTLLTIAVLYPAAALHVAASFWIYHANLKVKYALDPALPTSTLQFYR